MPQVLGTKIQIDANTDPPSMKEKLTRSTGQGPLQPAVGDPASAEGLD